MSDKRLIDANAILDRNNWSIKQYSEKEADAWRDGIALMKKNIENAPTIDPETLRPVAHWEVGGVNPVNNVVGNWKCSLCNKTSLEDSPFCPCCGAKMEE